MSSPLWKISAAIIGMLLVSSVGAHAQVCGDADGSGTVTVTDGVQALRAAAALSSTCSGTVCDIDGSGSVTVTDGVNVLRKAAGIAITENCGGVDAQVETLLRNTLPIFGTLTKGATGAQAAGTSGCDNPDGEFFFDQEFNELTFVDCELGGIAFDGTLGINGNTISFDLDFTDLATDEFFSFFGDLTERASGQNSILAGNLEVSFSDLGFIAVTFEDVVTDPEGNSIDGSILFDATDSDIDGVLAIRVGFAPSPVVPVSVFLADETQLDFDFDTISGELTPVVN
jgi:hypothetical protein